MGKGMKRVRRCSERGMHRNGSGVCYSFNCVSTKLCTVSTDYLEALYVLTKFMEAKFENECNETKCLRVYSFF